MPLPRRGTPLPRHDVSRLALLALLCPQPVLRLPRPPRLALAQGTPCRPVQPAASMGAPSPEPEPGAGARSGVEEQACQRVPVRARGRVGSGPRIGSGQQRPQPSRVQCSARVASGAGRLDKITVSSGQPEHPGAPREVTRAPGHTSDKRQWKASSGCCWCSSTWWRAAHSPRGSTCSWRGRRCSPRCARRDTSRTWTGGESGRHAPGIAECSAVQCCVVAEHRGSVK